MVEVDGGVYALPSGAVVESLRFARSEVSRIGGRDTLRVRDRVVPLLSLSDLFGVPGEARGEAYAVVVGRGEKRLALAVDRLRGQQDVVIKALDPVVSAASVAVAGATILGDGRVVLILDVAALFEGRRSRRAREA
jgi:two-component system chemotaxis sensor kinase CheA